MNYKKLISSRKARAAILNALSFVPDSVMLKLQYRIKLNRKLNLRRPVRFTEKLQWYKLNYRDPLMVQCVDKYDVRAYVEKLGLGHILNECWGVYDRPEDIDFAALPEKFVLKDTLGGGGNSVILVEDKARMDVQAVMKRLRGWVGQNHRARSYGREWPYYSGKKHRIIVEKYIEQAAEAGGLLDYKFFCFDGRIGFLYVMGDREVGESVKVRIFDGDFQRLPVQRVGDADFEDAVKPGNYEEMRRTAEKLAQAFPHVRVDLYNAGGKILFGELTFFNASGYMAYEPDSFDVTAGEMWKLPAPTTHRG